ncbi:MAG: ATP-dependent protease ATPase subunit HslU [Mariprofundaceae bacterium]|nr:ATP-dependent protease ATPase subunit HslU [Mariprofundaceae bacterium]
MNTDIQEKMMTPREIVGELDRFIVGQYDAKRAVAIALRNRWRRQQVPTPMREEITPKNILMMGPTGVGKTEISRRLAKLAQAPFIKVEATKYTEVGYVGRDVESIIRDLLDTALKMIKDEHVLKVKVRAEKAAEEHLLDILIPRPVEEQGRPVSADAPSPKRDSREKMRQKLRLGELDKRQVEIDVPEQHETPIMQVFSNNPNDDMGTDIKDMLGGLLGEKKKTKRMSIADALEVLKQQEAHNLIDNDKIKEEAISRTENAGIVFLDEIDKITHREGANGDISREGVQRDLLPLVEGTCVSTKHGLVNTNHILFIASGAFHLSKPSDLVPELQGRFPIRVHLKSLEEEDFRRILVEPEAALTLQYTALMATEDIDLQFAESGVAELARIAVQVNEKTENIGARRLHTLLERVLDEVSFDACERQERLLLIDADYVRNCLGETAESEDLSRYIL